MAQDDQNKLTKPGQPDGYIPNPPEKTFSAKAIVRLVLIILAILFFVSLAGALIYWLSGLILIVILAVFFAYLIAPLVDLVQRPFTNRNHARWMPRPVAIGIVYVGLFAAIYGAGAFLLPLAVEQVSQFGQQFPTYTQQVSRRLEDLERRLERTPIPKSLREEIEKSLTELTATVGRLATDTLSEVPLGLVTFLTALILIPVLGFFFLKDAQLFRLAAVQFFPRGQLRGRAELFLQDINKALAAYTRAQLISCALIGTICTAGFYVLGVRYALLLGIIATVLEFIPLAGPLIVGILATTVAALYSPGQAAAVAAFLLILRGFQDYVFYPRIVRESIHLHPLAIILAILAGGELAGVTGIFLAIPVVAVVTVTYRHLMEHSRSAGLVAELLDEGKTEKAIDVAEEELDEIHENAELDTAKT